MFHLIILGLTGLFILMYIIFFRNHRYDSKVLKVLGVLLFVAHCATLHYKYAIDKASGLEGIFEPAGLIWMVILKWFTNIAVAVGIFGTWFKTRTFEKISMTLLPIVAIFNFIYIDEILIAAFGYEYDFLSNYRTFGFVLQASFLLMVSFVWVWKMIKERDFKFSKKEVLNYVLSILGMMVAFFPEGALQIFFGPYPEKTKDFTFIHRICLYANVLYFGLSLFAMKGKSPEVKRAFLVIAGFSALSQYFYNQRFGITNGRYWGYSGLPLHLCNTAVILVFVAYVFKAKGLFYFSFFVNVLGAFLSSLTNIIKSVS